MKTCCVSLIFLLAFTLISCVSSQKSETEAPNPSSPGPSVESLSTLISTQPPQGVPTKMSPVLPTSSASSLEGLIENAKNDLAQRLSIPVGDISVVEAKAVTWPDGSLGCPQPGMIYTQVLTPGYLVKLKYASRDFEYHAKDGGYIFFCENPLPPVEGAGDNT